MSEADGAGRYAYEGLDRILHERARLGILTSLAAHPDGLLFNDLKELVALTDGNLSRHLSILQDAKLIAVRRTRGPGRTRTRCRLTAAGRRRFASYLAELERVVRDALETEDAPEAETDTERGWAPA